MFKAMNFTCQIQGCGRALGEPSVKNDKNAEVMNGLNGLWKIMSLFVHCHFQGHWKWCFFFPCVGLPWKFGRCGCWRPPLANGSFHDYFRVFHGNSVLFPQQLQSPVGVWTILNKSHGTHRYPHWSWGANQQISITKKRVALVSKIAGK